MSGITQDWPLITDDWPLITDDWPLITDNWLLITDASPLPLHSSRVTGHPRAYTLIEVIAVLAVLSVLALALTPLALRRTDSNARSKEISEMTAISNALVLQIIRSNNVPNEMTWAAVAASWAMRPSSQLSTNGRGFARLFFYDSGGWMSNAPYTQTNTGTWPYSNAPPSGRIAIVSTIANALPYTNGALSTANFNSIWNSPLYSVPSYLGSTLNWKGSGYDLVIQRIALDALFHHLLLTTRDNSTNAGYSINNSAGLAVPATAAGLDAYYFDGTAVGLWSSGVLTNTLILRSDISFTFDQGLWQAGLTGASKDNGGTATNFSYQASLFIGTDSVPGGHQGATAQSLLSAFYTFMYAYTIWGNECPHFQSSASSPGQQTDYQLLNALGANNGIIDSAAGKQSGLLK